MYRSSPWGARVCVPIDVISVYVQVVICMRQHTYLGSTLPQCCISWHSHDMHAWWTNYRGKDEAVIGVKIDQETKNTV